MHCYIWIFIVLYLVPGLVSGDTSRGRGCYPFASYCEHGCCTLGCCSVETNRMSNYDSGPLALIPVIAFSGFVVASVLAIVMIMCCCPCKNSACGRNNMKIWVFERRPISPYCILQTSEDNTCKSHDRDGVTKPLEKSISVV